MAGSSSAPISVELKELRLSDPCTSGGPMESEFHTALASQSEGATPSSSSLYFSAPGSESDVVEWRDSGRRSSIVEREQQIGRSKVHWSEVSESAVNREEEGAAEMENREVFRTLESHPDFGRFFQTFGYSLGQRPSMGELEVEEEPFAEGGQAELFDTRVTWAIQKFNENDQKSGTEYVLKVFRKGTKLRELQTQWPLGYLRSRMKDLDRIELGKPLGIRHHREVLYGTLLKDGRFAFLMVKEEEDLRSVIDRMMESNSGKEHGPFGRDDEDTAMIMYQIALGLDWLHNHNIVHRDLRTAHVLVKNVHGKWITSVADFECSVGVVGTGFWRAPEILRACKEANASERPEIFTTKADMYAYGMTCYEVLTGKIPFKDHSFEDHVDLILNGKRPEVPKYVASWARHLLNWCWHGNPANRPSFKDICNILEANSAKVRDLKVDLESQGLR